MEHAASVSVEELSHMEITIKTEVEAAATSTAHTDIEIYFKHSKQEPGLGRSVKSEPTLLVKEEILEDGNQASNEQQCLQGTTTPAGTDSVNEDCGTSLSDLLNVKQEPSDLLNVSDVKAEEVMDVGPTVLQHMVIHYTINKNTSACTRDNIIVDDSNESIPSSGVKKESMEDKLRVDKTIPCKYCGQKVTEDDNDEMHVKFCRDFKQHHHLCQLRTTSSISFKCDRTIPKPHLLNVNNKLQQRNCSEISMMSSGSNQTRDETVESKQKPDVHTEEYSSTSKFSQSHNFTIHSNHHLTKQIKVQTGKHVPTGVTRVIEEATYRCNTCDKRFAQNSKLVRHMRVHTGEKPYRCNTCDKSFAQNSNLVQHMTVHTREKPYRCDTCDKRYPQNRALVQHMRVHTREKPYRCDTCDKRFSQNSKLVRHMRVHTREKPYRCDICDKRFSQKSTLTQHMRVHMREEPYQCDTCDKRFSQNSMLFQHKRVHTGETPYHCDTCDAIFVYKSHLIEHLRVHTGVKPYKCDTCDKRFAQNGTLIRHMRVHTREKPYPCDTCDKRFSQKSTLVRHMTIHTREKPYRCDTCDQRFTRNSYLVQHMRVHKGVKIQNY